MKTIPLEAEHPAVTLSVFWDAARPPVAVAQDFVQLARRVATARGAPLIQD